MTAKTSSAPSQKPQPAPAPGRSEHTNLSYQYGTIGIQAVAAAARYADVRKKPADAQAVQRIDQRFVESAV